MNETIKVAQKVVFDTIRDNLDKFQESTVQAIDAAKAPILEFDETEEPKVEEPQITIADIEKARKDLAAIATDEYEHRTHYRYYYLSENWCARYASWLTKNTPVGDDGKTVYDLLGFSSDSTGTYMMHFFLSKDEHVKFYYNDNAPFYTGKNRKDPKDFHGPINQIEAEGDLTYIPKTGDLVFFDWKPKVPWTPIPIDKPELGTQDHTGVVDYYDPKTGILHTFEGNISGGLYCREIAISSNEIIGFGTWGENY